MRLGGGEAPGWSRHADVSAGMNWKHLEMQVAAGPGAHGETSARDWGVHARVTAVDRMDAAQGLPTRVDLAFGISELSYNDDAIVRFPNADTADPVTQHRRMGGALRAAAGRMSPAAAGAAGWQRVLREGMTPLVSLTAALDHTTSRAGSSADHTTDGGGLEVTVANMLSLRGGYVRDKLYVVDGATWGFGVGLPLGRLGGFRYDWASWPQAKDSGLPDLHRNQFTVWMDAMEIWREFARMD